MTGRKFVVGLLVLMAGVAVFAGREAGAIQLGDTRTEVETLHDTPPVADHIKGTAVYRWDLWKLEIQYQNDLVESLAYTKIDPMTEEEMLSILDQNGGINQWKVSVAMKNGTGSWARADGATAVVTVDANHKQTITLSGGRTPGEIARATPKLESGSVMVAVPYKEGVVVPQPTRPVERTSAVVASIGSPTAAPATPNVITKPAAPAVKPPDAVAAPKTSAVPALPANAANSPAQAPVPATTPKAVSFLPSLDGFKKMDPTTILAAVGGGLIVLALLVKMLAARRAKNPSPRPRKLAPPFADDRGGEGNPKGLESLTWRHFEVLLGEAFRRQGYEVESSAKDGADGIELRLRKNDGLTLAQCKFWSNGKVGVQALREFFNAVSEAQAARGIFICMGSFADDAVGFAADKPLELLDRAGVKELLAGIARPGEDISSTARQLPQFAS